MHAAAEIAQAKREEARAELARRSKWDSVTRSEKAIEDSLFWRAEIETVDRILREMGIPQFMLTAKELEVGVLTLKVHLTLADDDWVFFVVTQKIGESREKLKGKVEQQVRKDSEGKWTAVASNRSGCASQWVFEPKTAVGHANSL